MDPNCLNGDGDLHFLRLVSGADSSEACQILLINAIKDLKLDVNICGRIKLAN